MPSNGKGNPAIGTKWSSGNLLFFDRSSGTEIAEFDASTQTLKIGASGTLDVSAGTVSGALGTGTVTKLNVSNAGTVTAETYSATVAIDSTKTAHRVAGANGTAAASTFNASGTGSDGDLLVIQVTADGSGTCTITFGTNFKPSATLAVTASHFATVMFQSDGTNWKEINRSAIITS